MSEPNTPISHDDVSPPVEAASVQARGHVSVAPHLTGREVLVLGLGASGLAMARWCARLGAKVTVLDTRAEPPQREALAQAVPDARLLHGAFDAHWVAGAAFALVARSPGLAPRQWQALADAATAQGIPVVGEVDLFAHALKVMGEDDARPYRPQVLAVTGTNGKTTVTALTGLLLERAGWRVAVAGNIGPSMLDQLGQALDAQASADLACEAEGEEPAEPKDVLPQAWVLELSSFQLHDVSAFEPSAAVLLNITEDHLDWHGDMAAYAADKARIFGREGLMVLNRQDERAMALCPQPVVQREGNRTRTLPARAHATFGDDEPTRPGDWGIEEVNGMAWLVRALAVDETRKPKRGQVAEVEVYLQRLMPADALRIRGRHNATNALAALALASATGASLAPMLHGLREYRGEPHRVAPVAIVNEVEYFDDSKGTNVGATLAAIRGLGAERALVLILGGDGKGQNFAPLAEAVQRHVRAVVLIGRDAPAIRTALADCGVPLHDAKTLEEATRQCAQLAQPGDAVLLSPACASLDMFRNYPHRAEVFVQAVHDLAADAGEAW